MITKKVARFDSLAPHLPKRIYNIPIFQSKFATFLNSHLQWSNLHTTPLAMRMGGFATIFKNALLLLYSNIEFISLIHVMCILM